jgi:hypothetical protein
MFSQEVHKRQTGARKHFSKKPVCLARRYRFTNPMNYSPLAMGKSFSVRPNPKIAMGIKKPGKALTLKGHHLDDATA